MHLTFSFAKKQVKLENNHIKITMMQTETNTTETVKRAIAKIIGDARAALFLNGKKSIPKDNLISMGYEIVNDGYWKTFAIKDGIKVIFNFYNSNYTYDVDLGFYFDNDKYCHFTNIDTRIDEILAAGFKPTYVRPPKMQKFIDDIKSKIDETQKLVKSRCLGEIGGFMRSKGYFVTYDGSSSCTFSKDGIRYNASENKGWNLSKSISLYLADDILTAEFKYHETAYLNGLAYLELFVGDRIYLGRELTEMDRLHTYTRFKVRTYSDRYLDTVELYDDFEKAKQHAYDLAVEKAKSVNACYREWANTKPKDRGKEFDMLACFVWYECNNSKHLVFVQGEN